MSKLIFASAGALLILAGAAQAQSVTVGPGGLEFDRDNYARRDWERRREWDRDRTGTIVERRHYGGDCRVVTIQRENADGDLVTRRIRRCD
jgi:hypothetical protein